MNGKTSFLIILISIFLTLSLFAEDSELYRNEFQKPSPASIFQFRMKQQLQQSAEQEAFKSFTFANQQESADETMQPKQRGKAFIRSLILPGAGQRYLGKKTAAKAFFIAEISLWAGYFAFQEYGKWVREDALTYAATHSGADIDDKPPQFYVDIGNYNNIYEYNDAKQRMRQFNKVYSEDEYFWEWDDDANRNRFEQLRIAGDKAINNSVFVLGGIFANHLLSAIHAVWQTYLYNKGLSQSSMGQIKLNVQSNFSTGRISLNIQKPF